MSQVQPTTYIAFDVEAAGPRLGVHGTLSVGACVITKEKKSYEEHLAAGEIFYAELKPCSLEYDTKAMRVGCLHLKCIEEKRLIDARFDPTNALFDPELVLKHMQEVCEPQGEAVARLLAWAEKLRGKGRLVGVTDTVFFDSAHVQLLCGRYSTQRFPFGHSGLDIDSIYRGYAGRIRADLRELEVADIRDKPHRGDYDAAHIAEMARVLLFEKLGAN